MTEPPADAATPHMQALQQARKARRWSQLELAQRLGVSQRHVSFVETGRAKPSRDMLTAWLAELAIPLGDRNALMLSAGFAPIYADRDLQSTPNEPALQAITQLLQAHDPTPAFVLDQAWNVHQMNRGAAWLMQTLMPELSRQSTKAPLNLLDACLHPEGFTKHLLNGLEIVPSMLRMLRDDAMHQPHLRDRVEQLVSHFKKRYGARVAYASNGPTPPPLVLTSRFDTPHGVLTFFSMFTTFGTAQHITLASLRIEHLFPADKATRAVLERAL